MKKISTIVLLLCTVFLAANASVGDTLNYYVESTGDNSKDGLTPENAMQTLANAINTAKVEGTATTYIFNVGEGQIGGNNLLLTVARTEDITFKIIGQGADKTYYQMKTDAEFATHIAKTSGSYIGRVFNNPKNTGGGSLSIIVEDYGFRNFGYTNAPHGALIQVSGDYVVDFTMRRCVVERVIAQSGSLIEAANTTGDYSFTLEDCYFNEVYTINNGKFQAPIMIKGAHSLTAKNCVFSNFDKINPLNKTSYMGTGNKHGSVLSFLPTLDDASLTLINNTFIGDSATASGMLGDQSALYILSTKSAVEVTIANNIFIGCGSTTSANYYDINVAGTAPTFTGSTNNIMSSMTGFPETGNTINSTYTYTSEEINFTMDEDYPELFTTTSGVSYVKANGTEVLGAGLATIAPSYDIAGNERSSTAPYIGAYEGEGQATSLESEVSEEYTLYPNPVQDKLYIKGDVARVSIYNIAGSQLKSVTNTTAGIDVSQLASGIYLVKSEDAQGISLATQRIIKK